MVCGCTGPRMVFPIQNVNVQLIQQLTAALKLQLMSCMLPHPSFQVSGIPTCACNKLLNKINMIVTKISYHGMPNFIPRNELLVISQTV